jgi:hypothetical protein
LALPLMNDPKEIERVLHRLVGSARRRVERIRVERPGITFELSYDDIASLWKNQRGRCAVSGLHFSMAYFELSLVKHPYGPSLDRIDSHKGYVPGNVRLVCTAVNFGLGQWGDEVFLPIAEATTHRQAAFLKAGGRQLSQRIEAAEAILPLLNRPDAKRQKRRIAALKRARTLGEEGLRGAAAKARDKLSRA